MKLRYLFGLTLACALLLGACGGDDDDGGNTKTNGGATEKTKGSDATKASSGPAKLGDPTKAPEAGNTPLDDTASIFDKLASQATAKTYQGTYDMELNTGGKTQKGKAVLASKPPRLATRIEFTEGEFKGSLALIVDRTDTIICTDFGFGGSCTKSAGVDPLTSGAGLDIQKAIKESRSNSDVKELPKKTIAGRSSRCFEAKDKGTGTVSTFCLDEKDSIMTYMEIGGVTKMTATQISTSVDDRLFDLPFPVR